MFLIANVATIALFECFIRLWMRIPTDSIHYLRLSSAGINLGICCAWSNKGCGWALRIHAPGPCSGLFFNWTKLGQREGQCGQFVWSRCDIGAAVLNIQFVMISHCFQLYEISYVTLIVPHENSSFHTTHLPRFQASVLQDMNIYSWETLSLIHLLLILYMLYRYIILHLNRDKSLSPDTCISIYWNKCHCPS